MSNSELLERWRAGVDLTPDELLGALVYARATNDPSETELDRAEREARLASVLRSEEGADDEATS